ncbi:hypothetical protein [Bordetella petrii]|uniref:Uncharacterized protein n=1 Tax=Bordetella petrii (strain ATCC BAA-461 / DSM 12804 / CCUG 43448 / CIP 107267 / Se-1111R) TaxID=340100 RepID=A9I8S0_BORPD|nr:hypothetical protein [Bordetella petrii]CAP41281.1 conserved hypothetical protein [Bordetella petrii]
MSNPFRQARREKRRNKPYRPRAVHTPMLVATDLVLRPLEQIIDQLERDGTVTTDAKGYAVFQAGDGQWYPSDEAIEGVIWHFEMFCTRHGRELPLDGLRELHIALHYIKPVMESTVVKLKDAMPVLRRAMAMADPDDQLDLLQQTRIKAEMEARA